jgi:hypothetical protein
LKGGAGLDSLVLFSVAHFLIVRGCVYSLGAFNWNRVAVFVVYEYRNINNSKTNVILTKLAFFSLLKNQLTFNYYFSNHWLFINKKEKNDVFV